MQAEETKFRVFLPKTHALWIDYSTKEEVKGLLKDETCLIPLKFTVEWEDGRKQKMSQERFVYFLNSKEYGVR